MKVLAKAQMISSQYKTFYGWWHGCCRWFYHISNCCWYQRVFIDDLKRITMIWIDGSHFGRFDWVRAWWVITAVNAAQIAVWYINYYVLWFKAFFCPHRFLCSTTSLSLWYLKLNFSPQYPDHLYRINNLFHCEKSTVVAKCQ